MSRFRFGLGPAGLPFARSRDDARKLSEFCRRAEDAGFYSIGFGDHLDDRPAPIAAIAAAAACTTRLRVGVLVLCNELHNHAVLAQAARTLQVLSAERLEFGLGVGWMTRDFETAQLPPAPFGERLARLERTVKAVRDAFPVERDVRPPPLVIGGGGRRMLEAAARLADIVTINIPLRAGAGVAANSIAVIGEEPAVLERLALVRATNSSVEIQMNTHEVYVADDWREFARRRAGELSMSEAAFLASPHVLVGSVASVADRLEERAARHGATYWSMTGAALSMMAPVVRRLG